MVLGGGRSPRAGRGALQRSGWGVDPVTIKLEPRVAAQHEKELLVGGRIAFLVLVDDEVARGAGCQGSHSERRDAQVLPYRRVVTSCVREFVDLVEMSNSV